LQIALFLCIPVSQHPLLAADVLLGTTTTALPPSICPMRMEGSFLKKRIASLHHSIIRSSPHKGRVGDLAHRVHALLLSCCLLLSLDGLLLLFLLLFLLRGRHLGLGEGVELEAAQQWLLAPAVIMVIMKVVLHSGEKLF
jgi:hypothetical protein